MMNTEFLLIAGFLTLLFEGVAVLGRFVLKLKSRDHIHLTGGARVHHGYVGAALLPPWFLLASGPFQVWISALAAALIVSDLLHHFVVLPITIGATE